MIDIYHHHREKGGGRRTETIFTADGTPVVLKTFDEQYRAAQIMSPLLEVGFSRADAEAEAARVILDLRRARKFFGR